MPEQHPHLGQLVDLLDHDDPALSAHVETCEECSRQLDWIREVKSAESSDRNSTPLSPLIHLLAAQQVERGSWTFRNRRMATVAASLLLFGLFFLAGYAQGRSGLLGRWMQPSNQVMVADSMLPFPTVFYDTTRAAAWDWDFSLGALDSL